MKINLKGYMTVLKNKGFSKRERQLEYRRRYYELFREKYLEEARLSQRIRTHTYRSKPENKIKRRARRKVEYEIKIGRLKPEKCQKKGCLETKTQAHHDDYDWPLEIKWFCPLHHREYERKLQHSK